MEKITWGQNFFVTACLGDFYFVQFTFLYIESQEPEVCAVLFIGWEPSHKICETPLLLQCSGRP